MRNKKLTTQEKLILLLSIVPYLKENGATPVVKLATDFNASEKEIEDLVRFLGQSGIPGSTGAYLHNDLFDINWNALENDGIVELVHTIAVDDTPKLTGLEAAAVGAGLQMLKHLVADIDKAAYKSLQAKLSRVASAETEALSGIAAPSTSTALNTIFSAIKDRKIITFDYVSKDKKVTSRRVDPYALKQYGDFWYLRGYCALRKEVRTFREDGISNLFVTPDVFEMPKEQEESILEHIRDGIPVRVLVDSQHTLSLRDWEPKTITRRKDGKHVLEIVLTSEPRIIPLVASIPGGVEVLEPIHLREMVASWASDLSDVLGEK